MLAGLPALVSAQDEVPSSPEGVDWALTAYVVDDGAEPATVPFGVRPTIRLEGGTASGFGGCNQFSGSYQLDGSSLRFDEEMTVTLALCDDSTQQLEDAYLAALGQVDGWILDAGTLGLTDDFGDIILSFDVPDTLWTSGQMTELVGTLDALRTSLDEVRTEADALREDMARLNVDRLRERIKTLEADNKQLTKQVAALEQTPATDPGPGSTDFGSPSAAERVLLQGIPTRIANTCSPLRSSLPKGTQAAVTCTPNTAAVASVDYYLLEGEDAAREFGTQMSAFNVTEAASAEQTCAQGVKSQRRWLANGWQSDGCYRTANRAELRFVENATECRKLKVGQRTLQSPAMYIALQGSDGDVARVHSWATNGLAEGSSQRTTITQPIPSTLGVSPSCPT
jgi:heat shock protein HslJ